MMTDEMRKEIEQELEDTFKAYGNDYHFRRRDLTGNTFSTQHYGPVCILNDELIWEDKAHYMRALLPDGTSRTILLHMYEEGDVESVRIWMN